MRRILVVAAAALLVSASAPVDARHSVRAFPRIIMFHGGEMKERSYMVDWQENADFLQMLSDTNVAIPTDTASRRYVDVAMFYHGPTWEAYAADTAMQKKLDPSLATRARVYLADSTGNVLFDFRYGPNIRVVGDSGLGVLRKYRVPVGGK